MNGLIASDCLCLLSAPMFCFCIKFWIHGYPLNHGCISLESNISRLLHLVPVFYFCTVIWCLHYHLQHHPLWCFDLPYKTKFTAVRVIGAYFFTLKKLCSEHPVCWVIGAAMFAHCQLILMAGLYTLPTWRMVVMGYCCNRWEIPLFSCQQLLSWPYSPWECNIS